MRTTVSVVTLITAIYSLLFSYFVHAQDFTISQKDLNFSTPLKVIHPGDRVIFLNNDDVTHNVISQTNGFQFDLGAFKPGMKKIVNFSDAGVVDVECTVHPNMKLTLFIF